MQKQNQTGISAIKRDTPLVLFTSFEFMMQYYQVNDKNNKVVGKVSKTCFNLVYHCERIEIQLHMHK